MGRKKVEFNWDKLDSYLQLKTKKRVCALLLEVSEDCIERRIREKYDCTFTEYADMKLEPIKIKLIQKAINKALNGDNTMLIFCLKNLCGWGDRAEQEASGGIQINYSRVNPE